MESESTKKVPNILKKHKISVLKKDCFPNDTALLRCMKVTRPFIVKEDVIYRSEPGDFMKGEYPNLTIINRLNILANSSRTTAKYTDEALGWVERTSDDVAKLIGQKNYDIVFSALCSVISQELRIQELKSIVDDDSNISDISCGNISIDSSSIPLQLENPISILNDIDKHTQEPVSHCTLSMLDGSQVKIRGKPEDQFHIATAEILKYLNPIDRSKLMWYQAYIDWKYCLQRDEDNNLPIHRAVLNNDVDLLRRQCVMVKSRHESVDIPIHNNLTALQISISQESAACTAVLLKHGANPLATDDEHRTTLHLAAEESPDHLMAVIDHCRRNARHILYDNELWMPELEDKTEEDISKYLLSKVCRMYDNQGCTPLILASRLGKYTNVQLLLDADPKSVNVPMPNCGNTALYSVVTAACIDAKHSSNKSKAAEHFVKTVEVLVRHGADPAIENKSGSSANQLLNDYHLSEVSMIIANSIVASKYPKEEVDVINDFSSFMLVKEESGAVNLQVLKREKGTEGPAKEARILELLKTEKGAEGPAKEAGNLKVLKSEKGTEGAAKEAIARGPTPPATGILAGILGASSPREIIICANKTIKREPSPKCEHRRKPTQSRIYVPVATKNVAPIDKRIGAPTPTNAIRPAPKVVAVAKLDAIGKVNVIKRCGANVTSAVTLPPSDVTTAKISVKKKPPPTRDQTRDVPIKKQKRGLDQ
ncbi:unnamed protein product, partial [Iphiclides podalirius]